MSPRSRTGFLVQLQQDPKSIERSQKFGEVSFRYKPGASTASLPASKSRSDLARKQAHRSGHAAVQSSQSMSELERDIGATRVEERNVPTPRPRTGATAVPAGSGDTAKAAAARPQAPPSTVRQTRSAPAHSHPVFVPPPPSAHYVSSAASLTARDNAKLLSRIVRRDRRRLRNVLRSDRTAPSAEAVAAAAAATTAGAAPVSSKKKKKGAGKGQGRQKAGRKGNSVGATKTMSAVRAHMSRTVALQPAGGLDVDKILAEVRVECSRYRTAAEMEEEEKRKRSGFGARPVYVEPESVAPQHVAEVEESAAGASPEPSPRHHPKDGDLVRPSRARSPPIPEDHAVHEGLSQDGPGDSSRAAPAAAPRLQVVVREESDDDEEAWLDDEREAVLVVDPSRVMAAWPGGPSVFDLVGNNDESPQAIMARYASPPPGYTDAASPVPPDDLLEGDEYTLGHGASQRSLSPARRSFHRLDTVARLLGAGSSPELMAQQSTASIASTTAATELGGGSDSETASDADSRAVSPPPKLFHSRRPDADGKASPARPLRASASAGTLPSRRTRVLSSSNGTTLVHSPLTNETPTQWRRSTRPRGRPHTSAGQRAPLKNAPLGGGLGPLHTLATLSPGAADEEARQFGIPLDPTALWDEAFAQDAEKAKALEESAAAASAASRRRSAAAGMRAARSRLGGRRSGHRKY